MYQVRRTGWHAFPDVSIHAAETTVKRHPCYARAKAGSGAAAVDLIGEVIDVAKLAALISRLAEQDPVLVSVHAEEEAGRNAIPEVLAEAFAAATDWEIDHQIVQANVVNHTGASGYARLARQALFSGEAKAGRNYVIVDDFIGQGGTIANLKGWVESQGGHVLEAVVLTGKPYSAKIAPSDEQINALRAKHGQLEEWWQRHFGFGFECLTESEARYRVRSEDADAIRDRILEAAQG